MNICIRGPLFPLLEQSCDPARQFHSTFRATLTLVNGRGQRGPQPHLERPARDRRHRHRPLAPLHHASHRRSNLGGRHIALATTSAPRL